MTVPTLTTEPIAGGLERTKGGEVDLAFRTRGSGPVVVMLHGTSASHAVWEPVAQALVPEATTVAVDQRGHGRSDKPSAGYAAAEFADDVVTVLDAIGAETAVVAGHSLGARNAWVAAARHPDRISGIVCVDYTPWVEPEVLDVLQARVAAGDREFADLASVRAYLQERYPLLPADAVDRRAEWGYRTTASGTWRPLADPGGMQQLIDGFRDPHEREFRAVAVPARHIRGAGSAIVRDAAWTAAIEARPQDAWRIVPDADHYVVEETPGIVAEEIRLALATAR
ncbi:alpha/beta fold hydrolase [Microbacterium sp. XT11]|uniref:alpha/beta fold hydrolase n=1 Tax=Microbacterium sp. XT11 TaxID=367477 RepID=UPI000742FD8B|nr:alpha/beta hydrolase [Microbacterium sp. XT11]ALX65896.1 hypothetical protein AB663_000684 [Microbacterium sp. XT11]